MLLPCSLKSEEEVSKWLNDQNIEVASLDDASPEDFYAWTLQRLGVVVRFTPRWTEKDPVTGVPKTMSGTPYLAQFWINRASPFTGSSPDQMILVQRKQVA